MKIIDLHCDTLLWSVMKPEDPLEDPERQITVEKLIRGGALAQCFALFVPTDGQGSMAEQELSFEEALKRLETIVAGMEKGDVSLSDSMAMFEEGTALIRRCSEMLDRAEQQVVRLKKGPDGAPEELPFDVDDA